MQRTLTKKKSRKAWIQIVEASISMMILFGLTLGLLQQQAEKPDIAKQVYKIQHQILSEASDDPCIRNAVLSRNETLLKNFIAKRLCHLPYNFTVNLCAPTEACLFPEQTEKPKGKDIYADSIIIAANLTSFNPVKISMFAWTGGTKCEEYRCEITEKCPSEWNENLPDGCAKRCQVGYSNYQYYLFRNSCTDDCTKIGYDRTTGRISINKGLIINKDSISFIPSLQYRAQTSTDFLYGETTTEKIQITLNPNTNACTFSIEKY